MFIHHLLELRSKKLSVFLSFQEAYCLTKVIDLISHRQIYILMNLCSRNLIVQECGPSIDTFFFKSLMHVCKHKCKLLCCCSCQHTHCHYVPSSYKQLMSWKAAFVSGTVPHIQLSDSKWDDIYASKIFGFLVPAFPFLKISCMNTMYSITFFFYDPLLSPSKLYCISKLVPILLPVLSFLFGIGL